MFTENEYRIYAKVRDELLLEDSKIYVKEYLANKRDCMPWDIDDDEIENYDYYYLLNEYKDRENGDEAPNYIWSNVIEEYFENNEFFEEE